MKWKMLVLIVTATCSICIGFGLLYSKLTSFSPITRNIIMTKAMRERTFKADGHRVKASQAFYKKDYATAESEGKAANAIEPSPSDNLSLAETYDIQDKKREALAAYTTWVYPTNGWSNQWLNDPRAMMRYSSLSLAAGNRKEASWAINMAKSGYQGNYHIDNKPVLAFVLPDTRLYNDYTSVETASQIINACYANTLWQYIERSLVTLDRVEKMTKSDRALALIHFERARELENLNMWATPKYGGMQPTVDTSHTRIEKEYIAAARYDRKYRFLHNSLVSVLTPQQLNEIYGGETVTNEIVKR